MNLPNRLNLEVHLSPPDDYTRLLSYSWVDLELRVEKGTWSSPNLWLDNLQLSASSSQSSYWSETSPPFHK